MEKFARQLRAADQRVESLALSERMATNRKSASLKDEKDGIQFCYRTNTYFLAFSFSFRLPCIAANLFTCAAMARATSSGMESNLTSFLETESGLISFIVDDLRSEW